MEWISVKDRLPEYFIDVLVACLAHNNMTFVDGERFHGIDGLCKWSDGADDSFRTTRFNPAAVVTHWMHLPELPKD